MKNRFRFGLMKDSLLVKTTIMLVSVAILQGLIFVSFTMNNSTITDLEDDAFRTLENRVSNRKNELEEVLTNNINNSTIYKSLNTELNRVYNSDYQSLPTMMNEDISQSLIALLRNTNATGAFAIYDKDVVQRSYYPTLYLRDLEPTTVLSDNTDILSVYGHGTLVKELGITMDPLWQPSIMLDRSQSRSDFYFQVFDTASQYPDYQQQDLGYWSKPFNLQEADVNIITYSFPLFNEQHEVYGVAGLEFSCDYLNSFLDYSELDKSRQNAYIIGIEEDGAMMTSTWLNGPTFSELTNTPLTLTQRNGESIFNIEESDQAAITAQSYLTLYNRNTPFAKDRWSLLGVVRENALLNSSNSLIQTFTWSFFTALVLGILAAIIISYMFTRPIKTLSTYLSENNSSGNINLPRVHIAEIDNLSTSIENLSKDVAYASSRLSQILQVMNMPLGAIEYNKIDDTVYCTEQISELLDFRYNKGVAIECNHEKFLSYIAIFRKKIETSFMNEKFENSKDSYVTVRYTNRKGIKRWISFHTIDHENEYLIVVNDVSAEIQEKQKLEYERDYDVLTNLLNRRAFRNQTRAVLEDKGNEHGAMIMWDLDNLKYINDTYGHDFGDKYICAAADVFATLQEHGAIVARMAGDEFLAYFWTYKSEQEAKDIIRNTHSQLSNIDFNLPDDSNLKIRASAGISWYPNDANDYDELIKHADYAMYHAKSTFKGGIKDFSFSSYEENELLFSGQEELNQIFEQNLVNFMYQPIVDATTGSIFGYEALMRPNSPHITTPLDIIRLAKAQSMLYQLEYLTWSNVLKQYFSMQDVFQNCKIFINSIPNTHIELSAMDEITKGNKNLLSNIVVEIIESDDVDNESMEIKRNYANHHGLKLAIDDYGSGYNHEGLLLRFSPDFLKIDMNLIQGISQDKDREQLVSNIIEYAHAKQISVIAEGIEDMPDLQICIKLGVDYVQGFYLGRPAYEIAPIRDEKKNLIRSLAKVYDRNQKGNF